MGSPSEEQPASSVVKTKQNEADKQTKSNPVKHGSLQFAPQSWEKGLDTRHISGTCGHDLPWRKEHFEL